MKFNELINEAKRNLMKVMKFADNNGTSYKLMDGTTIIVAGDLATDADIYSVGANDEQILLGDGDYILEDGRTLSVAGGKVSAINEAVEATVEVEAPVEEVPVEFAAPDAVVEDAPVEEAPSGDDLETRVKTLEDEILKLYNMLQEMGGVSMSTQTKLEEFMKAPAPETVNIIQERKLTASEERKERFMAIKNSLK